MVAKSIRYPQKTVAHSFKDILHIPRVTISLDAIESDVWRRHLPPISLCLSYPIGLTRVISKAPTLTDGLGLEGRETGESERAGNAGQSDGFTV